MGAPTILGPTASASQSSSRDYSQRLDGVSSAEKALPEVSVFTSQATSIDVDMLHTDMSAQLTDARGVGLDNLEILAI